MKKISTITLLLITMNAYCQQLTLVKDSIIDEYMKSGFATKTFRPEGQVDKDKQRQGIWKDYEVVNDYVYVSKNGKPQQSFGHYLLYGEGEFVNGKREKAWKIYVIEDKTFNKLLQQELHYVNGEKVGAFTYFFPNGTKGIEGDYVANYLEGEIKSYYEDGKLYSTRQYKHGLKVGRHTYLYPTGKLEAELNFINDTLNGHYQTNYENGNSKEVFSYNKGMATGNYKYYYENGQLWVEKEYKDGLLLNVKGNFDPKGNSRDKGTLVDGNGTVVFYTEEGKVYSEETYKNGKKINEVNK